MGRRIGNAGAMDRARGAIRALGPKFEGLPIVALTQEPATLTKMTLDREVVPLLIKHVQNDRDLMRYEAEQQLIEAGVVKNGDLIVLCHGDKRGMTGGTNTMTIVKVGERA